MIDLVKPTPLLVTVAALVVSVAILGAGSALEQTPQCRTYSTEQRRYFSIGGSASEECDFNSSTFVFTCTMDLGVQVARRIVSVRQYASVADFVDEVRVIPPISRAKSGSTTYVPKPAGPDASDTKLAFHYDAQRRQTDMLTAFVDGRIIKTTFTAWDPSGRPLAHNTNGQAFKFAYDDSSRTMSIAGPGGTQTQTYDQNGNLVKKTEAPMGGTTSTTTVTISQTAKVCR
jgi:YD repeat-containing protein